MIIDYHVHTKASQDAMGDMKGCVKEASKKGIGELGFSDHAILHYAENRLCRQSDWMKSYVQKFLELKETSEIPIKMGAEIDFNPNETEKIRDFINKYPFDYVMGAVHYIGNWGIDSRSQMREYLRRDILKIYEEYFEKVRELCSSRLFDILAHADLIKIFGFKPGDNIHGILSETADVIAESKICVEVNTSGLMRPCGEIYPSRQFLKILFDHRVPVTLGSDAHKPQDVGRHLDKAIKLIKEIGYLHICKFQSRKVKMERL